MSARTAAQELQRINAIVHEKTRLGIMTYLISTEEASFTELKGELQLTDGNLNLHMRVLEEAGYVRVRKEFVERKPRTTYRVSEKGLKIYKEYVAVIARLLDAGRADRAAARSRKTTRET